ncbi:hypothetical protein [Microbacterium sp.]|uniref:hypothetical protein n=1 Tax=Microbacterium sp. TaxID=51671 RepID=UPI001AC01ED9|nr:hypothetical protein [Microbacterium sp.]MBN9223697.1 hypothetical protein [Microbacterium sp.]
MTTPREATAHAVLALTTATHQKCVIRAGGAHDHQEPARFHRVTISDVEVHA